MGAAHLRAARPGQRHVDRHRQYLLPRHELGRLGGLHFHRRGRHRRPGRDRCRRGRGPAADRAGPGRVHQQLEQRRLRRQRQRAGLYQPEFERPLRIRGRGGAGIRGIDSARHRIGQYVPHGFGQLERRPEALPGDPRSPGIVGHAHRHAHRAAVGRQHRRHRGGRRRGQPQLERPDHRRGRARLPRRRRPELDDRRHRGAGQREHGLREQRGLRNARRCAHRGRQRAQRREGRGHCRHADHRLHADESEQHCRGHRHQHRRDGRYLGRLPRGQLRARRARQRRRRRHRRRRARERPEHGWRGRRQLRYRRQGRIRLDAGHATRMGRRRLRRHVGPGGHDAPLPRRRRWRGLLE